MVRQGGLHHGPSLCACAQADLIAYGLEAVVFLRIFERVIRYAFYENSCCMIDPSRTSVMGRPVELLNSVEGSIPKLW